jgi:hypothetical protein
LRYMIDIALLFIVQSISKLRSEGKKRRPMH